MFFGWLYTLTDQPTRKMKYNKKEILSESNWRSFCFCANVNYGTRTVWHKRKNRGYSRDNTWLLPINTKLSIVLHYDCYLNCYAIVSFHSFIHSLSTTLWYWPQYIIIIIIIYIRLFDSSIYGIPHCQHSRTWPGEK